MTAVIHEEIMILPAVQTIETIKGLHEEAKYGFNQTDFITIDASQVETIDTASLQLLAILFQSAQQLAKTVVIQDPSPGFVEASQLSGLISLFGITTE